MDFGHYNGTPQTPACLFCPLADSCMALAKGKSSSPCKNNIRQRPQNRYLNYIYVRAGAYTFINKRTENDIWKNLFELPLIETAESITEEALLALPEFTELFVGGGVPKVRLVCRDVKCAVSFGCFMLISMKLACQETPFLLLPESED